MLKIHHLTRTVVKIGAQWQFNSSFFLYRDAVEQR